jgi:hypothetical protein
VKTNFFVASGVVAVIAGLLLVKLHRPTVSVPPELANQAPTKSQRAVRPPVIKSAPEPKSDDPPIKNLSADLLSGKETPRLSRAQIDSYLAENHRSAESLLTAFRLSGDRELLKEASEKAPHDPRVALTALFKAGSPEERRQWLDTFKQSAPDNALPNYLSALDYFKAGQPDQAAQELLAASARPKFQDYSTDFVQNAEEAYRSAGYPGLEAKAIATWSLELPQFKQFLELGDSLAEMANSYRQAGDEPSAQTVLQLGLGLGQRLASEPAPLLQELVSLKVQNQILSAMDPASPYGDSGQTIKNRMDEIAGQRAVIKGLAQQTESLLQVMSEPDAASFYDRLKMFGEMDAVRWAAGKYSLK